MIIMALGAEVLNHLVSGPFGSRYMVHGTGFSMLEPLTLGMYAQGVGFGFLHSPASCPPALQVALVPRTVGSPNVCSAHNYNPTTYETQRVQLECHYGIRAHKTIYGMVFGT